MSHSISTQYSIHLSVISEKEKTYVFNKMKTIDKKYFWLITKFGKIINGDSLYKNKSYIIQVKR